MSLFDNDNFGSISALVKSNVSPDVKHLLFEQATIEPKSVKQQIKEDKAQTTGDDAGSAWDFSPFLSYPTFSLPSLS